MYNQTYSINKTALNRCNKIYGIVFLAYAICCGLYMFTSVYLMILMPGSYAFSFFIDGVIFKALIFTAGTLGSYKKHDIFACVAPVFAVTNYICSAAPFNPVFIPVSVIAAVLNILANKKYRVLEQCDGFPYFNERFESQKEISEKYKDKEVFRDEYEQLRKSSSSTMDDI